MLNPEYLKMLLERQLETLHKLQLEAKLTGLQREEVITRCEEITKCLTMPTFNQDGGASCS